MDVGTSIALVFPGQGSQSIGMLQDYAEKEPVIKATFNEASELLDYDLWEVISHGPKEQLDKTDITQPALLTAGVAIWRLWRQNGGVDPAYLAGHSLGEYTALVCAGSLKFSDAVTLVRDRGRYMQEAVPEGEGAMAAIIGIDPEVIKQICEEVGSQGLVDAANFNSPEQTVIAGELNAVVLAMELSKQAGAKRALKIPVSVPSHCKLMQSAADKLAARLEDIPIADTGIPVLQNVDAHPHISANEIKSALIKQLHQPVLWVDTVNRLAELGCETLIEVGPGKVLSGLIKRINRDLKISNLDTIASFESLISELKNGN
jgi:[acyl-carrier-protein] S-malonyltransferase